MLPYTLEKGETVLGRSILTALWIGLLSGVNKLLSTANSLYASSATVDQLNGSNAEFVWSQFLNTTDFTVWFLIIGVLVLMWIWYAPLKTLFGKLKTAE